ncbi:MAG: GNAT family N-acetyltransferase [Bacteroidales bacterium]|nr:GNAT family N-acetyltransferase [Bacteroidales bacterium]
MTDKEKYEVLEKENNCLPVFLQTWWLDIVCNKSWNVFLEEKKGRILYAFPYFVCKKKIFTSVIPPLLSPCCGAYIDYSDCKSLSEQYSLENRASENFAAFIKKLNLDNFVYTLRPESFFSMGFYWLGFTSKVRYTFRIDISEKDLFFKNFHKALRKSIKDASKILTFSYAEGETLTAYNILKQTYDRQKTEIPYTFTLFDNLVKSAEERKQGKLFFAKDQSEKINGVIFIVWDKTIAYNLIGGIADDCLQNDVMAFLTYNAMLYCNDLGLKIFDMEGSMIKGVEHHFRLYNGKRYPYLEISKKPSVFFSLARGIKKLIK